MKISEYPESQITNLKRSDRIFLKEIKDGYVLIERGGVFYKHKLPDDAMSVLLLLLNGELAWYSRAQGRKRRYDPE